MAQTLYCGLQRSGKSYEVVSNVIVPAIEQGRDVISNIAGLNQTAIYEFLMLEGKNPSSFGRLITVTEEQVLSPDFWLTDKDKTEEQQAKKLIKAGMLVALDEIWRFFPSDEKVPNYVMNFFRMHGHFVNQTNGLTCEISLICQHPDDLHRAIKRTVMTTFMMEKCADLGLDKQYKIFVYEKTRISRKPSNVFGPYSYNSKYFPLYKSNSINDTGIKPREVRVEKRNNIFNSKLFRIFMPLAVFMLFGGIYGASSFFSPDNKIVKGAENAQPNQSNPVPNGSVSNLPNQVKAPSTASNNAVWRVAGLYGSIDHQRAILINQSGDSRIVIPRTVSHYAEIISITTHTENATYSNAPFTKSQGLIQ